MPTDPGHIETLLKSIISGINVPFWVKGDFWIFLVIGVFGLLFSVMAFIEARRAKQAATEAARNVRIQTITIDLTELSQRLDKLSPDIKFTEARDMMAEMSRRIRRLTSPFKSDNGLSEPVNLLWEALSNAKQSLKAVKPANIELESETPLAVYNAIESDISDINDRIADVLGLLERRTIDFGDNDGSKK
ncbi:hypothetical protein F6V25_08150 [Oryzomonas japonica]|uniref:Uncharacterized protein n=1 Tax=Oryzomonas japonica TaxID=2603858 RepID=A0A7J4ZRE2_9BACT|nr:hypothetical protein [Oryzomonas japonica]KAB0665683.1 hypothetical protein F6V25_08150 [Oryzomonas japonica]